MPPPTFLAVDLLPAGCYGLPQAMGELPPDLAIRSLFGRAIPDRAPWDVDG